MIPEHGCRWYGTLRILSSSRPSATLAWVMACARAKWRWGFVGEGLVGWALGGGGLGGGGRYAGQVLLVGEDEAHAVPQFVVGQHAVEIGRCLPDALPLLGPHNVTTPS